MEQLVQLGTCRCIVCNNRVLYSDNNEIVCSKCGTVLGYDNISYDNYTTASELNLYNMVSIGSKVNYTSNYIHNFNDELSLFSNLCDRLELPRYIAIECWKNYKKLTKYLGISNAEIATLAIYFTCKKYSYKQYNKDLLIDIVASIYSRVHLPTLDKLISNFLDRVYKCNDKDAMQFYLTLLSDDDRVKGRALKVSKLLTKTNLKEVLALAC